MQRVETAAAVLFSDDGYGLARRQVIARRRQSGRKIRQAEVLLEHLGRDEQAEPPAHVTP